ncbi:MAG: adenylate/guanylate cyclase domain-containing protein, partial [Pseudomonadota bacterium]
VEQLGKKLIECGAPVWRVRLNCLTLNPLVAGWSVIWSEDQEHFTETQASHQYRVNDSFVGTPMHIVSTTRSLYRKKMDDLNKDSDHSLLFALRDQGATDYVVIPLIFSNGEVSTLIVVSQYRPGFSDSDIAAFNELAEFIAPVFETFALRRSAQSLLETYVGKRTGKRVLEGQIQRGDGELIEAAVWFCDLRGFTTLTESISSSDLIDLLNEYFEIVSDAVEQCGGEVLKFIGDAMLVVFPVTDEVSRQCACRMACRAAMTATSRVHENNRHRTRSGSHPINFGLGLHVGEVVYGNVGAPERLDFTVLGAAVNMAARVEGLSKSTGYPILMTNEVAQEIDTPNSSVGYHELKGVHGLIELFALQSTELK